MKFKSIITFVLTIFLISCANEVAPKEILTSPPQLETTSTSPVTDSPTATILVPTIPTTVTSEPTATDSPERRIIVREDEFFNAHNGENFVPRGVNHIEITSYGDCTLATGQYDSEKINTIFAQLAGYGYNTVRMFLDTCKDPVNGLGSGSGGLNAAVLDNIVDLMRSAKEHGIYLLLTSNDLPDNGGYWQSNDEGIVEGVFGPYRNTHYLTTAGVRSATDYWDDLMSGLEQRNAPFDALLGWQLLNEQWYFNNEPPFSLTEGVITTANGKTYDMSDIEQKRAMANDGIIYWIEQISQIIHTYDPKALITMGFFDTGDSLLNPETDFRYNNVPAMLESAPLDFIDFHAYPGGNLSIEKTADKIGLNEYHNKPIVLGEFGAFRETYEEIETGAFLSAAWMEGACQAGFDGWLYWVYGKVNAGAPDDPWGFIESDALIMETLAPRNAPDPCNFPHATTGPVNLAYGASATASSTEEDNGTYYLPQDAVDFSLTTWWSAGAGAIQWIEIDLGAPATIERFKLVDLFGGPGLHVNKLWGKGAGPGNEYVLLATLEVNSEQNELIIEHTLSELVSGIQYIKVETVASPGWIIWHEIEVYGTPDE